MEPSAGFSEVRSLFRALRLESIRPVCVFDEFDAARYLLRETPQVFHWLRELASNAEFKAAIVLISKRRLQDVARLAGFDSDYWANVLMTVPIRCFSRVDVDRYFVRLGEFGVELDEGRRKELLAVCGGHPYLLDVFAHHSWEQRQLAGGLDAVQTSELIGSELREYAEQLATVLKDGASLNKMIQVLVGPQYDVCRDDIHRLIEYGVLENGPQESVLAFSEFFASFLQYDAGSVEIWPLWRDTERALRDAMQERLENTFGRPWSDKLVACALSLPPLSRAAKETHRMNGRALASRLPQISWPTHTPTSFIS